MKIISVNDYGQSISGGINWRLREQQLFGAIGGNTCLINST
jgi:hypothetical protein